VLPLFYLSMQQPAAIYVEFGLCLHFEKVARFCKCFTY